MNKEPYLIAVGGGKGGVGKSFVSANLSAIYAKGGLKVILVDLDLGAANLHTIFGITQPKCGLGDILSSTAESSLEECLTPSGLDKLTLIPGSGYMPEVADINYDQKVKIASQLKNLDADLVILDLGAGSSLNVIDFFTITNGGIIVATPEPTSIMNAYEFIKNVVWRLLMRILRNESNMIRQLKNFAGSCAGQKDCFTVASMLEALQAHNPAIIDTVNEVLAELDLYLIFNQARALSDAQLSVNLNDICHKNLHLQLHFPGLIFHNEEVGASVQKMTPLSLAFPESISAKTLKRIGASILQNIIQRRKSGGNRPTFMQQYGKALAHARHDYIQNSYAQKKLQNAV